MTQKERDAFREKFLVECFQKHGTNVAPEAQGGLMAVGVALASRMGLDADVAKDADVFFFKRKLISGTFQGGVHLTPLGQDHAERLLRAIEATTSSAEGVPDADRS